MEVVAMKSPAMKLALLALVVSTIGCDRVTKHVAADRLAGTAGQSYLADTLRLEYAENAGAFLSLGADWPAWARHSVLAAGTALLLAVIAIAAVRNRWSGPALVGASLICTGGASNLVDRLVRGSVVDFINVGVGPVRTGIFNVADLAITLGVVLLVSAHRR
jgi:signal peptidase II